LFGAGGDGLEPVVAKAMLLPRQKSNSTNCQHLIGKKINVTINRSP
jgi:hypothetical protein